jgi:uncharacterized protein YqgV (UPF0045/DUF77 family)
VGRRDVDSFYEEIRRFLHDAGVEWEIDALERFSRREYGLKIGIYPWGKTILEGTRDEILEAIREIVDEIQRTKKKARCPACGRKLPDAFWTRLSSDRSYLCACGAEFIASGVRSSDPFPFSYRSAWERVLERVGEPGVPDEVFFEAEVSDLLDGVWCQWYFEWPVFVVAPGARWKPFSEWSARAKLFAALHHLGFVCRCMVSEDWEDTILWEGSVAGEQVAVGFDEDNGLVLLGLSRGDTLLARFGPRHLDLDDDRFLDSFTEFLMERPVRPCGWVVSDFVDIGDECLEGAHADAERLLKGSTVGEVAKQLAGALSEGVAECCAAVHEFLGAHEAPRRDPGRGGAQER